jgi:hypothetical protein
VDIAAVLTLGIDPGLRGGLALLDAGGRRPQLLQVADMPADVDGLHALLRSDPWRAATTACIERVHSSPQMGVASAFTFGRGLGRVEGALAAVEGLRVVMVAPNVWKPSMRLSGGLAAKRQSVDLAKRLWPEMAGELRNDGRAEAALIGLWGVRA